MKRRQQNPRYNYERFVLLYPLWQCQECSHEQPVSGETAPPMCCGRRMAFWRPERLRELAR